MRHKPLENLFSKQIVSFAPSRVDGLENVKKVIVYRYKIKLETPEKTFVYRFGRIATWPDPAWLNQIRALLGTPPKWLPVADRDSFHAPPDRFFRFYTKPPIKIFMPINDKNNLEESTYWKVREILWQGGYNSSDLG